jgi:very-short-patch-repair endonuclease
MDQKGAPDARVALVASAQHGVVSIWQLREAGLSSNAVRNRVRRGILHPVHRGVYAVGHPGLTFEGRCMGAALAFSDAQANVGFVSHRSAAALWKMLPATGGPVDVALPARGGRRRRRGIRLHRSSTLTLGETGRLRGVPVTAAARTLEDLRRVAPGQEFRRALREAEALGLEIGSSVPKDRTRSELESLFLRLCKRHRLPLPAVNARLAGLTVDFLWAEQRLVVETDGFRFHRGRVAFEEDRARDLRLRSLGYQVLRLTYRQVTADAAAVAQAIRRGLEG